MPLRNYVVTEKKKENTIYCTLSLSLQLTGQRDQDQISWGLWAKCPSNCPVCIHASTMPMQSPAEINAANACLRAAAEADGGNGKFKAAVDKSGCYCFCQNCFGDKNGIGCWRCFELATTTKSDVPSDEVEPGICRFDCGVCKCNLILTFNKCKRQTIANGVAKNAANKSNKKNPIKTRESQQEGGQSIFANYIKLTIQNYSVRDIQDVDHRLVGEIVTNIATKTAINVATSTALQCNPHVMRGLQDIIPCCRRNIKITPAAGDKMVSMSYQQARKELKGQGQQGQRKNPPKIPSLDDHTPPPLIFLKNAGNRARHNRLSSIPMNPHGEQSSAMVIGTLAKASSASILERVQKRVLNQFSDKSTTPQTKKVVAKVHVKLAHVACYEDIQSLQEISATCIELQCAMEE